MNHKYKAGTILREHSYDEDDALFIVEILGVDISGNYKYRVLISPTVMAEGVVESFPINLLDENPNIEVLSKNWKLLYGKV